ncbi:MAG: M48 family metallopeptidase [Planctomycetota bacterium]
MVSELISAVLALVALAIQPMVFDSALVIDPWSAAALFAAVLPIATVLGFLALALLEPQTRFQKWRLITTLYRRLGLIVFVMFALELDWTSQATRLAGGDAPGLALALLPYLLLRLQQWPFELRLLRFVGEPRTLRSFCAERARVLVLLLVPLLAYEALIVWVDQSTTIGSWLRYVDIAWWGVNVVLVLLLVAWLPFALRWVLKARPLPAGPLRDLLLGFSERLSVRFRDVLLWETGGRIPNAAVVGFWARSRFVVFTDALLAKLTPTELLAVLGHEAGHVAKHHFVRYLVITFTCFISFEVILHFTGLSLLLELHLDEVGFAVVWGIAMIVYWRWVFGWFSRRFEQEADLHGARSIGSPETFAAALDRIAGVGTHARKKRTWRYFSIQRRIDVVRSLETDPVAVEKLEKRLRWTLRSVFALTVVASVLGASLAWNGLRLDWGAWRLQTGDPREAGELIASVPPEARRQGLSRDLYLAAAWLEAANAREGAAADAFRTRAQKLLESDPKRPRSPRERAVEARLLSEWERQTGRLLAAADRLRGIPEDQKAPGDARDEAKCRLGAGQSSAAAQLYLERIEGAPETSEVLGWLSEDLD